MKIQMPSMTGLKVFEAASRHLNFTRAAAELNVTQTAVSHQVKALEDLLGTRLFVRNANAHSLKLTVDGEAYLVAVKAALDNLVRATLKTSRRQDQTTLLVHCVGMYSIKRLLPKLPGFRERHPAIDLQLTTCHTMDIELRLGFDVAIWHGAGHWPGVHAEKLTQDCLFPVCSPGLLQGRPALESVEELQQFTIIRSVSSFVPDEWSIWLNGARYPHPGFPQEVHCELMTSSLYAAIDHLGIAMGRSSIVQSDLRSGRLMVPLNIEVPSPLSYYLITREETREMPKVRYFREWLLAEVADVPRGDM